MKRLALFIVLAGAATAGANMLISPQTQTNFTGRLIVSTNYSGALVSQGKPGSTWQLKLLTSSGETIVLPLYPVRADVEKLAGKLVSVTATVERTFGSNSVIRAVEKIQEEPLITPPKLKLQP